jgi:hypothetical protein
MRSLDFSIDVILSAVGLEVDPESKRNEYQVSSWW